MRPIVGRRCTEQFEPMRAIELPDDNEMREALDVGEPRLKLGQDLERAICLVFSAKPLGNLACVLVRTAHKSNRPRGKHRRNGPPFPILMPYARSPLRGVG